MIHRKILFYVFTLLSIHPIDAQTREEALSEFDWLTGFIQRNYPGYEIKTQGKEDEWNQRTAALGHRPIRPELQRRPLMGEHHPGGKRQISVHHTKGTCPTGKKPPSGILQHVLHRQGHERQHLFSAHTVLC